MDSMHDTGVVADPASGRTSHTHRLRGLVGTGAVATLAATAATVLAAALARAVGVDFEVPDGGETIPLSGIAVVTGFFSVIGVVIAAALRRWSARPAERFVRTAVTLTAISLVPPLVSGADTATITALVGLHLVAATVMIPALARSLAWSGERQAPRQLGVGRSAVVDDPGAASRVYVDMVGDLFHAGHVSLLREARRHGDWLVVGVLSDDTAASYKRRPIMTLAERVAVIESCKYVDEVIEDAPFRVTEAFLDEHAITTVVHGDDLSPEGAESGYGAAAAAGKLTYARVQRWCLMTRDEAEHGIVRVGPFWDGVEGRAGGRRVW